MFPLHLNNKCTLQNKSLVDGKLSTASVKTPKVFDGDIKFDVYQRLVKGNNYRHVPIDVSRILSGWNTKPNPRYKLSNNTVYDSDYGYMKEAIDLKDPSNKLIAKIYNSDNPSTQYEYSCLEPTDMINMMASIFYTLDKIEVCPKLYDLYIRDDILVVIMQRYDKPLRAPDDETDLNKDLKDRVIKLANKMHKAGIIHNDLHAGNIVVRESSKDPYGNPNGDMRIIDFDTALFCSDTSIQKWDLDVLTSGDVPPFPEIVFTVNGVPCVA